MHAKLINGLLKLAQMCFCPFAMISVWLHHAYKFPKIPIKNAILTSILPNFINGKNHSGKSIRIDLCMTTEKHKFPCS